MGGRAAGEAFFPGGDRCPGGVPGALVPNGDPNVAKAPADGMLTEKKDISEFVLEIKKTLDQVGTILAKEALEALDSLVKSDSRRKQNWHVHEKSAPNTLATIFGEVHY